MTKEQLSLVQPILNSFENEELKNICVDVLNDMPEYIWEVPASQSGKYHPEYALGKGGLMRHMIATARILNYMLELEQSKQIYNSWMRDCLRIAALVHDGRKCGETYSGHTAFEHPILMAGALGKYHFKGIEFLQDCVRSHMGEWNTSKKSEVALPKPYTTGQHWIHLADYLASRKDIIIDFTEWNA